MKTWISVIAFMLLACGTIGAAEKPAMDIPTYPGGEATMEINLTQEDLLPTLQALLPMVKIGGPAGAINPEDIAAALKDVTRLEFLQIDIAKNPAETQVADYYANNLPSGQWSRVFWQKSDKGNIAVYAQGKGEGLYGFRVSSKMDGDKPIKCVQIIKTEGKIDFAKLLSIASKIFVK